MPIFRKEHLAEPLRELDEYYKKLRGAVEGTPPSANVAVLYHYSDSERFTDECANVDLLALKRAIGHFKVAVESLQDIKPLALKPQHRP